jgi:hypothetical protein
MFDLLDRSDASRSSVRRWAKRASQNGYVTAFFAVVTLWVLVADDLRLAAMPPAADAPMAVLAIVCMVAFVIEIAMYSLGTKTYLFSFFFWLDVLATASMILDVPAVKLAIQGASDAGSSLQNTTLARATRMSRMGTKAGRVASVRSWLDAGVYSSSILYDDARCSMVACACHLTPRVRGTDQGSLERRESVPGSLTCCAQVIRVVRLIRLVKLFKHVDLQRAARAADSIEHPRKSRFLRFTPNVQQSHVGQKLTELTTKRVVLGVLTIVLVLPFLDVDNPVYGELPAFARSGLQLLHDQALIDDSGPMFSAALQVRCC